MSDFDIQMDYNGLWFVTNAEGFPISQAFETEQEAKTHLERVLNND
jgi:hypothetical protein